MNQKTSGTLLVLIIALSISRNVVAQEGISALDIPIGAIISWDPLIRNAQGELTGESREVPVGWQICDGSNGTPDLTDRFLKGETSRSSARVGQFGGAAEIAAVADHTHSGNTDNTSGPAHGTPCSGNCGGYRTATHAHRFETSSNGAHSHGSNLPPFYTVIYLCNFANRGAETPNKAMNSDP